MKNAAPVGGMPFVEGWVNHQAWIHVYLRQAHGEQAAGLVDETSAPDLCATFEWPGGALGDRGSARRFFASAPFCQPKCPSLLAGSPQRLPRAVRGRSLTQRDSCLSRGQSVTSSGVIRVPPMLSTIIEWAGALRRSVGEPGLSTHRCWNRSTCGTCVCP